MHRLRALDDSDVRRSQLSDGGRRLVLIRPSWIGMGAAATVRTRGNGVTLLGWDPIPLPTQRDSRGVRSGSAYATDLLRSRSILPNPCKPAAFVAQAAACGVWSNLCAIAQA